MRICNAAPSAKSGTQGPMAMGSANENATLLDLTDLESYEARPGRQVEGGGSCRVARSGLVGPLVPKSVICPSSALEGDI